MTSSPRPAQAEGTIRIEPRSRWGLPDLGEIWRYRGLLYLLAWRNVQIHYKQTILGGVWALLQPVLTTVVFTIFFGGLADIPSDGVPYFVFSLAAMVPFSYVASTFEQAANSLVSEANLITKVYFPRTVVPASFSLSGLIDLAVGMVVLVVAALVATGLPSARVLLLPILLAMAVATALGSGMLFAALNVQFRDVRYTIPFIRQLWLFLTPIAYPASLLDESWQHLYAVNPMVGVVEGFRWALLPVTSRPVDVMVISGCSALVLLLFGAVVFRRTEARFADVV